MRHGRLIPALVLGVAALVATSQAERPAPSPAPASAAQKGMQWVPLEDGMKRAAAAGKYTFVTVYTDWCTYCRRLNQVTFRAQPVLDELHKNFQSVRVNAESDRPVVWKGKRMSEREVAGVWGVKGFPTMLFLSPKGEIIGTYSAYADPELMVQLLTYISSGARERNVSFDDFVEGRG